MSDKVISDTEWAASLLRFIRDDVRSWKQSGFNAKTMMILIHPRAMELVMRLPFSHADKSLRVVELWGITAVVDDALAEPFKIIEVPK